MFDQAAEIEEVFLIGRAFFQRGAPPFIDEALWGECIMQVSLE
jgi:hypothetical protein